MTLKTRHWQRLEKGGLTFTELGFGSAPLGNLYRAIGEDEAQDILEAAWAGGVRYFDTAPLYGLGLAETVPGRSPLLDGFGLVAFASLFPIIAVLTYAQLSELRDRVARSRNLKNRNGAESALQEES